MTDLSTDLTCLRGVGEQRLKLLAKLGIHTLRDLLEYFPRAYEDRSVTVTVAQAPFEQSVCIRATVSAPPVLSRVRRGMELVKLRAFDDTGSVDITFFNQSYVRNTLRQGQTYVFYGKIGGGPLRRTMTNPEFESADRAGTRTGRIMPRYRLCSGVSNTQMSAYVRQCLELTRGASPNPLPEQVREKYALAQADFAYANIHFPADFTALELARRRLVFQEFFVLACALGSVRGRRRRDGGVPVPRPDIDRFYASLGFEPTLAQRRAVDQAIDDMVRPCPMNRLVQGDVGSGKTLVAAACAWAVGQAGMQTAFMAPTEILAEQHTETLRGFLLPFGLRVDRLTGSMTAREKREAKARLASGETALVVGTHALLTADVEFSRCALVITDEQHRFGVNQRGTLSAKGEHAHTLVMSATPIPRTLALMIYGDLDVSIIDELPPGRHKVDTFAVDDSYRRRLYGFMEKLVGEGRQVFVVCPMVEENEEMDCQLKSAEEHAKELAARFPSFRVECVHGRMKAADKNTVMSAVVRGEVDILVSTTVIEVGVDVPNAALMVVENAERFGLSQLHQLRGRVGRGQHKSWCILVSDSQTEDARARLKAMCSTNDGFRISEEDLRLRGPGDFFGSRQHGLPEMHIARLGGGMDVLKAAQDAAHELLEDDPELRRPENAALAGRVRALFEANADVLN